jgi:large-conductance mechanosensitive channel
VPQSDLKSFASACVLAIVASTLGFGFVVSRVTSSQVYSTQFTAWFSIVVYFLGLLLALGAVVLAEASKSKEPPGPTEATPEDVRLLREIRDALKK